MLIRKNYFTKLIWRAGPLHFAAKNLYFECLSFIAHQTFLGIILYFFYLFFRRNGTLYLMSLDSPPFLTDCTHNSSWLLPTLSSICFVPQIRLRKPWCLHVGHVKSAVHLSLLDHSVGAYRRSPKFWFICILLTRVGDSQVRSSCSIICVFKTWLRWKHCGVYTPTFIYPGWSQDWSLSSP